MYKQKITWIPPPFPTQAMLLCIDGMLFVKGCIAVSRFSPQIEALTHTMAIGEEKRLTGWLLDFKTQYSANYLIHQTILFKSSQN